MQAFAPRKDDPIKDTRHSSRPEARYVGELSDDSAELKSYVAATSTSSRVRKASHEICNETSRRPRGLDEGRGASTLVQVEERCCAQLFLTFFVHGRPEQTERGDFPACREPCGRIRGLVCPPLAAHYRRISVDRWRYSLVKWGTAGVGALEVSASGLY